MQMSEYEKFIKSKLRADIASGFDCDVQTDPLFDFQAACVKWALKRGRAALFLDTGLGKTLCQTTWADKVVEHTGGNVIIVAPLCVAQQTVEEAGKFGITVKYCRSDEQVEPGITITNYEMLEHFDLTSFAGVVLDESSILKNHTSKTREQLVQSFRDTPYKLSCTATPSPNDYIELGNQADFLGVMNAQEMLATFFTHDGGDTSKWRLKGHGKVKFWEWMSSWSICIRNPDDLGFDGSRYILPALRMEEHLVSGGQLMEGQLFHVVAQTLSERREAKRNSMEERINLVKQIVDSKWFSDKLAASAIGGYVNVETGVCSTQEGEVPVGRIGAGKAAGAIGAGQGCTCGIHEVVCSSETGEVQTDAGAASKGQRSATEEVCRGCGIPGKDAGDFTPEACGKSSGEEKAAFEEVRNDAGMSGEDAGCVRAQVRNLRAFGEAAQDVPNDRPLPHIGEGSGDSVLELQHGHREVQGQPGVAGVGDSVPKKEPVIIWCHLNDEQDALEKAFGEECFSVRGSMSPDEKVAAMMGWLRGERPVMISKPSIMGAGLNFQHCANMVFAGMNDSFEEFYQAVRRCYRFGQKREVTVHIITAETEGAVKANIERKQKQANTMADQMVAYMRKMTRQQIEGARSNTETYNPTVPMIVPAWINNNIEA